MSTNVNVFQLPSPMASPPRSCSPTKGFDTYNAMLTPKDEKKQKIDKKKKQPSLLSILEKYISDLEGRDKSIKIIQYTFKILLHYQLVDKKRWTTMVSHFSQTRKILRVGHWLGTIQEMHQLLLSSSNRSFLSLLAKWCTLWITLGNEVADDLFCFYKMGVFGPSLGKKAEKISIYCWFIGIWIDFRSNIMTLQKLLQQQKEEDQQKIFLTKISCTKLLMDGIFCACDIWEPSFSPVVQAWSGFFSGSLSGYKLWYKIKST
ncbi:peroxisomal biogenesis factor 11-domain-containing protein [Halteromyces radiatus]|uniref:peroxisomal biogenesis factor 11-domain-containing protein n=1 Tax=Halteromyces radiatus TaxID=101107 RepID=UPI002221050F|nr:peroxisomal biogenesis factor 11-domain-containing protein [Halteromyces radiatus]KAI8093606.1 peroxisomal biogenesis factor 11-domain-containing protein [Halteromyces radiatus]